MTSERFERLPCGCVMGTIDDAFVYVPCSLLCEYYLYTVEQAKETDTPVITRRMI